MKLSSFLVPVWLLTSVLGAQAKEPIRLHPNNPHYFSWRDRPTILITAGEHYGAVINLDFDYLPYLAELRANRFNLTRVFSGAYREVPGSFNITGNTLAPAPGRFISPWARTETAGASDGGNKFDLTKWDAAYFDRLKDFIQQADAHGVVVELVFFCTMYDDAVWQASPLNPRNNVNGLGDVGKYGVYDGKNKALLEFQKAMVHKLVTELNHFDNLYYEICNEPYERGGLTKEWNDQIIATIVDTETPLPKKHLIAQGFPPAPTSIKDLNPKISVLNFHAASPDTVRLNYPANKVVAFDETGGSDRSDRKYRTEGWDFILAGGGVYDHLDFSFMTEHPDGASVPLPQSTPGGGGPELRRQIRVLKEFMEGFDFIRMKPDTTIIKSNNITLQQSSGGSRVSSKATVRALSEPGKAYAIYVNGGIQAELVLGLPTARYQAVWINAKTGQHVKSESFNADGFKTLASPRYSEDIALRVTRQAPTAD